MYAKIKASKNSIYNYINDYDIFRFYISNFKQIRKLFRSEIRADKNPTCCINKYKDKLLYVDFADIESKGLDAFAYIQKKYSCTFYEALDMIVVDFNLPLLLNCSNNKTTTKKPAKVYNLNLDNIPEASRSVLKVKIKPFTLIDKSYWYDKYDITVKDLKKYNVYSLEYFIHYGKVKSFSKHLYGYYFGIDEGIEMWKVYYPHGDKFNKWATNCGDSIIQGYNELPDKGEILIITKSLKDIIVLSKLRIPAIAPQAENHLIPKEIINELKTRFKRIYILFDNDNPGIEAAKKYKETYELPIFFIPLELEVKDSAEVVEWYDYSLLKDIIHANCNTSMVI